MTCHLTAVICGCLITIGARHSGAQSIALGLPPQRALAIPPPVAQFGVISRVDGTTETLPVTPSLATADLTMYARQLASIFPTSGLRYPEDSVTSVQVTRAAAWVNRFDADSAYRTASRMGWQAVPLAEAAAHANNDTVAQRLFETRLAELAHAPAEQSYVLLEAIRTFADSTMDSARLVHTVGLAERYATRLHALPVGGYQHPNDSTSVLYRHIDAEASLIAAYDILGVPDRILAHTDRLLTMIARVGFRERPSLLLDRVPYATVYMAILQQPNASTRLAAFNAKLTTMGHPGVGFMADMISLIGKPAPPILVNAVFNTRDSVFQETPWPLSLRDGQVHVLVFDWFDRFAPIHVTEFLAEQIHRQFPAGVVATYVTRTRGYIGYSLAEPAEEVAWLRTYYQAVRPLSVPIAVWAPQKVSVWPGMRPPPSPSDSVYHIEARVTLGQCVVIDSQGIVRAFYSVRSHAREAALMRYLETLLARNSHP